MDLPTQCDVKTMDPLSTVIPAPLNPSSEKSFSWGKAGSSVESDLGIFVSFEDVMREQSSESSGHSTGFTSSSPPISPDVYSSHHPLKSNQEENHHEDDTALDTTSDELLAQLLQHDFDDEFMRSEGEKHDKELAMKAQGSPPKEVFSVGFDVMTRPLRNTEDDSGDEDRDAPFDDLDKRFDDKGVTLNSRGIGKTSTGKVVTKHDLTASARRNACKVMEFTSNISTGDGVSFDMKLNNSVFNRLKVHSTKESKRMARLHEKKEKSTAESVMDEKSRLLIFKMMNQGILDEVNGAINTGKEAVVYHGVGSNADKEIPQGEVAIKVFKTTLNEFRNREPYIKEDYRFKDRCSKPNNRKVVPLWAEKEMHNLIRIKKSGVNCPTVVCLKKHVLVMTFIGSEGKSAPILKEAVLSSSQLNKAYSDSVVIMKDLYTKCGLIHADLSEFNLMWYENQVWVIDVSQAVMTNHPHALGFLLRDCVNVTNFFSKSGALDVMTSSDLFTAISGKVLPEGNVDNLGILNKIEEYERDMEFLTYGVNRVDDSFEVMFSKACDDRKKSES